jgi:hypothetical protein
MKKTLYCITLLVIVLSGCRKHRHNKCLLRLRKINYRNYVLPYKKIHLSLQNIKIPILHYTSLKLPPIEGVFLFLRS